MISQKLTSSQGGYSLMELTVTLGLVVIIGLGGAYYVSQGHTSVQRSITQGDLSSHHQRALQRLKSASFVTESLGLNTAHHQECFSRRSSTDCTSLANGWNESSVQFESCPEEGCLAQHQLRFRLQCETRLCSSVDLDLTTTLNPAIGQKRNLTAKPKNSQVSIPSLALTSRAQLSFDCARGGQRLITGLNQENLEAECDLLSASLDCGRNDPLRHFGDQGECQTMAQETCAQYGFSQLGAFRNQGRCNTGGRQVAAAVAVVATTTTLPLPSASVDPCDLNPRLCQVPDPVIQTPVAVPDPLPVVSPVFVPEPAQAVVVPVEPVTVFETPIVNTVIEPTPQPEPVIESGQCGAFGDGSTARWNSPGDVFNGACM